VAPAPSLKTEAEQPKTAAPDIKYLKTRENFALPESEEKLLWIIAFLTLYISFGIQIWRSAFGTDPTSASEMRKRAHKKLQAARALAKKKDWRGVGVECSNAIISTLGEMTGAGGSTPAEDLLRLLPTTTVKLQESIRKFLSRSEVISFAPQEIAGTIEQSEIKKLVSEAERLIGSILEVERGDPRPAASVKEDAQA
jgi:hypothetical protein